MASTLETLKKLMDLASPTGEEEEVQLFLKEELLKLGFRASFEEVSPGRSNLVAERGESSLLITSNADTFPFCSSPPGLLVKDGRVSGAGVLSSKGQIAALLEALSTSDAPVKVAFLVDGEGKGEGAQSLKVEAEGAIVLKPTSLKPCWRGAGLIEAELKVRGKEAHSACWNEGLSALQLFLEAVDKVKLSPTLSRHYFSYGRSGVNILRLEAGSIHGVVPGRAEGLIEIPVYPPSPVSEILKVLEDACLEKRVSLRVNKVLLPFESEKKSRIGRLIDKAWREENSSSPPWSFYPGWSEASYLVARGVPSIVLGAGDLALSRTEEEGVNLEELQKLTAILVRIINHWSGAA